MAKTRPSVQKRRKEAAKLEKKRAKEHRRATRQAERDDERDGLPDGVDPDLVGIVPGPQPPRADDW